MTQLSKDPETVDIALEALARFSGSPAKAHAWLIEEHDLEIPPATLSDWKTRSHAERYQQIEVGWGRKLEQAIVEKNRSLADRAGEVQEALLETLHPDQIKDPKERAQALRAVSDLKAKAVNEVLALTGRPVDGKNSDTDMARSLKFLVDAGVFTVKGADAEGTAEEVTDAHPAEALPSGASD